MPATWTILIYRLPAQPSKHRLSIWRKLVAIGVVYLQDGVCVLPKRDDLDENLQYIASQIQECGGTYHFLSSTSEGIESEKVKERFRAAADDRMEVQLKRLQDLAETLDAVVSVTDFERAEEELKRERIAFLKASRLSFFGSDRECAVTSLIDEIRTRLDLLTRGGK